MVRGSGEKTNDKDRKAALRDVRKVIADKFDYQSRRYLLEAIKAQEVIPHIREHMAMGRKVVVFHDYNQGGGFNPFDMNERARGEPSFRKAAIPISSTRSSESSRRNSRT